MLKGNGEDQETQMMVRIHDMSFDGVGVLSEEALVKGDKLMLRLQLQDYIDPLTLHGKVSWVEKDIAGIHRAGIGLAFEEADTRLILADFMFGRLKAQSSEIILDQRRNDKTPIKPVRIEVL